MATPDLARWARALWALVLDIRREFDEDDVGDVAAGTTYWLLLSIPAGILAMVSALGWLGDVLGADLASRAEADVVELVSDVFADEADVVVRPIRDLFDQPKPGLLTTSILVALFSLSRGFAGLIRGLDRAYGVVDGRSWVHLRLVAVGLSLGSLATVAAAVVLQVALAALVPGGWPAQAVGWVVASTVLVVWAASIFHVAPYHRTPWRYDLPGAVLAAVVWALVSAGYRYYVDVAGDGNEVLGAIGAAILALTWLYAIVLVLLVGAELNDILARRAGVVEEGRSVLQLVRTRFSRR